MNYRLYKKIYSKNIEYKKELKYIKNLLDLKVINKNTYLKNFNILLNKINNNNKLLLDLKNFN